jgi:multiple sugar transport system permease protein
MIIFLAGLRQIPQDLYEAAMDYASKWRQFRRITLPLLAPQIFFNLVLQTSTRSRRHVGVHHLRHRRADRLHPFYTLYLYEEGFGNFRMGTHRRWHGCCGLIAAFTAAAFLTPSTGCSTKMTAALGERPPRT